MASSSRSIQVFLRTTTRSARPARSARALPLAQPQLVRNARYAHLRTPYLIGRRWASTTSDPSTSTDPSLGKALDLLDSGSQCLEEGDLQGALVKYKESLDVKETSGGWFNLGVCEYHLNNHADAITAWEKSIALTPSADAYTNLASAYIMSKPPQPALAIKHLTSAMELSPEDPEIAFNLAAILESTDNLEPALKLYEKANKGGIDRAAQNVRSVSAKILAKKAGGSAKTAAQV